MDETGHPDGRIHDLCLAGPLAALELRVRGTAMLRQIARSRLRKRAAAGVRDIRCVCGAANLQSSDMTKLVPVDRTIHQPLRVINERVYSVCRETTICPVLLTEIPRLVVEYPIAFTRSSETGKLICVALFGVDPR